MVAPRNQSFTYDDAGNLLEDGVWRYYYDAVNRLRRMDRVDGITGLPPARNLRLEFRYDEQGRRVEKKVMERGSGSILSFQRFIYEGWNLVGTLEIEGEGTEQTAGLATRYVWRTGSADTGSFGLLMVAGDHDNDPTTLPRAYFTGYDGRGNLTSLAENRQGVAAAAWEYSPFGEVLRAEGSAELPHLESLGATFGFSTQYTDSETGLVYFGHRYYHPGMGRFLNKDPLGEAGGLNRYAYALNDPINRTDYRGLCYTGPVDSLGYRYFQSMSDPIYGSEPIDNRFLGSSSGRQQSSTTAGAAVSTDGAAADSAESGTSRPYRLIKTDANGNGLVEVTDREAFDAMVRDWENTTGQQGLIPRDQWAPTGEFDIGGNFHITGFRIKAPWEGGTSWLNQSEPAGGQASSQGGSGGKGKEGAPYYPGFSKSVIVENGVTYVRVRVMYKNSWGEVLTVDNAKVAEFTAGFERYWTNPDAGSHGRLDVVSDPNDHPYITATIHPGADVANAVLGGTTINHYMDDNGWTSAHELGHSLGLTHGDQFGMPGIMGPVRDHPVNSAEIAKVWQKNAPHYSMIASLKVERD